MCVEYEKSKHFWVLYLHFWKIITETAENRFGLFSFVRIDYYYYLGHLAAGDINQSTSIPVEQLPMGNC